MTELAEKISRVKKSFLFCSYKRWKKISRTPKKTKDRGLMKNQFWKNEERLSKEFKRLDWQCKRHLHDWQQGWEKYDFDRSIQSISLVLPKRKRECLTLSLTDVTRKCIKRKAKLLNGSSFMINYLQLHEYVYSFIKRPQQCMAVWCLL